MSTPQDEMRAKFEAWASDAAPWLIEPHDKGDAISMAAKEYAEMAFRAATAAQAEALAAVTRERDALRKAAEVALSEMCKVTSPGSAFTEAVDGLDAALATSPERIGTQDQAEDARKCPHCNYTGSMHCGDVAEKYTGGCCEPKDCSYYKVFGPRATRRAITRAAAAMAGEKGQG